MNSFYKYLESQFKEKYKLNFIYKEDKLIIKNFFYILRLKKDENSYELFYLWKQGTLIFLFNRQHKKMLNIYKEIKDYSKKKGISISEIHYS